MKLVNLVETITRYEERDVRFKLITQVSVDELMRFYTVTARFPSPSECAGIAKCGIDSFLAMWELSGRPQLIQDFEKLEKENPHWIKRLFTTLKF